MNLKNTILLDSPETTLASVASLSANSQTTATDSFSAKLGFRHGIVPALVIGCVVTSRQDADAQSEPCRSTTQIGIARSFPYLKAPTVIKAIQKLRDREVLIHERTMEELVLGVDSSFSVAPSVREAAHMTPVSFRISDAMQYGLRAAIVLSGFETQWHEAMARNPEHWCFKFSPATMAKRVPLGISTIQRKMKSLEAAGVIAARCAAWSSGAGRQVEGSM